MKKPGFRGPLTRGNLGQAFTESGGINAGTARDRELFQPLAAKRRPAPAPLGDMVDLLH